MKVEKVKSMGMDLTMFTHKSCCAMIGEGDDWATIYSINSEEQGKGHASELIMSMQNYYLEKQIELGSTVALSNSMKHLLIKFKIPEYN